MYNNHFGICNSLSWISNNDWIAGNESQDLGFVWGYIKIKMSKVSKTDKTFKMTSKF